MISLIPLTTGIGMRKQIQASGGLTYEFTDECISVSDSKAEVKEPWDVYQRGIETRHAYILVYAANTRAGRSIPRRAFETPEQETAFRGLLARKLNFEA